VLDVSVDSGSPCYGAPAAVAKLAAERSV
jgi:hypothetical protein